jgi:hypothetical protein
MNERQRVQAEPQVHVVVSSGREMRLNSRDRLAESTTSVPHRDTRRSCLAMLRPQRSDLDCRVARSVAMQLAHDPGVANCR